MGRVTGVGVVVRGEMSGETVIVVGGVRLQLQCGMGDTI